MTNESNSVISVFVSQPFGERTYKDIDLTNQKIRHAMCKRYPNRWIRTIPSYISKDLPEDCNNYRLWYFGESLKLMSKADIIAFAPGWKDAVGCQVEHDCAIKYGFKMEEFDEETINNPNRRKSEETT